MGKEYHGMIVLLSGAGSAAVRRNNSLRLTGAERNGYERWTIDRVTDGTALLGAGTSLFAQQFHVARFCSSEFPQRTCWVPDNIRSEECGPAISGSRGVQACGGTSVGSALRFLDK